MYQLTSWFDAWRFSLISFKTKRRPDFSACTCLLMNSFTCYGKVFTLQEREIHAAQERARRTDDKRSERARDGDVDSFVVQAIIEAMDALQSAKRKLYPFGCLSHFSSSALRQFENSLNFFSHEHIAVLSPPRNTSNMHHHCV
jgi:hypothetical protein